MLEVGSPHVKNEVLHWKDPGPTFKHLPTKIADSLDRQLGSQCIQVVVRWIFGQLCMAGIVH